MGTLVIEELLGSPELTLSRQGNTATRRVKVPGALLEPIIAELFPSPFSGYPFGAAFPGVPFLFVDTVQITPFFGEDDTSATISDVPDYAFLLLTINYRTPRFDNSLLGRRDPSGPGGKQGSQGNQNNPFLTHSGNIGGQFLTYPAQALVWATQTGGGPTLGAEDPNAQLRADVHAGVIVPTTEHTMTWNFVAQPPWDVIGACRGRVNSRWISGCPAGTLLFLGCQFSKDFDMTGTPVWKLVMKFSEKNTQTYPAVDGLFNTRTSPFFDRADWPNQAAYGWNHFLRFINNETRWDKILKKTDLSPLYSPIDFDTGGLFVEPPLPPG